MKTFIFLKLWNSKTVSLKSYSINLAHACITNYLLQLSNKHPVSYTWKTSQVLLQFSLSLPQNNIAKTQIFLERTIKFPDESAVGGHTTHTDDLDLNVLDSCHSTRRDTLLE